MRKLAISTFNNKEIKINVPANMIFKIGKGFNSKIVEDNKIPLGHFLNHSQSILIQVFKELTIIELQKMQEFIKTSMSQSTKTKTALNIIESILN